MVNKLGGEKRGVIPVGKSSMPVEWTVPLIIVDANLKKSFFINLVIKIYINTFVGLGKRGDFLIEIVFQGHILI